LLTLSFEINAMMTRLSATDRRISHDDLQLKNQMPKTVLKHGVSKVKLLLILAMCIKSICLINHFFRSSGNRQGLSMIVKIYFHLNPSKFHSFITIIIHLLIAYFIPPFL